MTGMNATETNVTSLVSCVSVLVLTGTICTAWKMGQPTFASEFHKLSCTPPDDGDRDKHLCTERCSAQGICYIDPEPQAIKATFTGIHETFQYTKVCDYVPPTHVFFLTALPRTVFSR